MKNFLCAWGKNIVITDKDGDIKNLENFSDLIMGMHWKYLHTLGDFLEMCALDSWNFVIHPRILEIAGSPEYLERKSLYQIHRGTHWSMEDIIESLISLGYTHSEYIGELAKYKREGSIITLTHAQNGNIYHIEWFDTEIDSIIEIDALGKRHYRESVWIKNETLDEHSFERKIGVLNEALLKTVISRNTEHIWKSGSGSLYPNLVAPITNNQSLTPTLILIGGDFLPYIERLRDFCMFHFTDFHRDTSLSLDVGIPDIAHIESLKHYISENSSLANIRIYTKNEKTVHDFLEFHGLSGCEVIHVEKKGLESFEMRNPSFPEGWTVSWKKENDKTIILADDILDSLFVRTRSKKSLAKNLDLLLHLCPGDYVVHREHGIARFHMVIEKTLSDIRREYLELHYAWGDKLFVPLTDIYRVSKYVGELEPTLTSLSGKEWERTLEKTDEELEKIANELIEIASKRTLAKWIVFQKFPKEEEEFQSRFLYEHTPDQRETIDEIFRDMESEFPMDRLLSGDVGFGKTEVAMNAIYKAILSGYQVAVVSPLLVLADEHYETFLERFSEYGIRVECLTRMTNTSEEKRILHEMKDGTTDIVIGTHKLFGEHIRWKKLGLLIIDEEHKFWVSHKEAIKKMRANVDILTLSATPIPRSLNLALSWLKKVSLLSTPPKKKKPIETIVTAWNEHTICHAIDYELERGGQIIIIHNRIRGMESMGKEIDGIVKSEKWKVKSWEKQGVLDSTTSQEWHIHNPTNPLPNKPTIVITHGQMPGEQIEDRIHAFKKWDYNILLTTTIIENGVNFLRANTIIIIDPEDFGLAQLHQLRGRVGRKGEQGYCYLMYRKGELAAIEKERIITIANNTHLGAGFEIAMRDMEIRGAWDVLGFKQAGKSKDIGLTLYFRMLEEKIASIKDEKLTKKPIKIELDLSYTLDNSLFQSDLDKLNFFREIENIETLEELDEMEEEMKDSFVIARNEAIHVPENWYSGSPHSVSLHSRWQGIENLFLLLRARILYSEYGLESLKKVWQNYIFDFYDGTRVEKIRAFLDRFDRKNRMTLLSVKKIRTETRYWKDAGEFLEEMVW